MSLPYAYDAGTALAPGADAGPALRARVAPGPQEQYTAVAGMGFAGTCAVRFDGDAEAAAGSDQRVVLHALDGGGEIAEDTVLSYVSTFDLDEHHTYAGGYTAVDLVLDDGSRLSDRTDADGDVPRDQLGFPVTPAAQGASKAHYPHQWNLREIRVGAYAAGRRVTAVELWWHPVSTDEGAPVAVTGWVDAIELTHRPPPAAPPRPVERVITTRGTNATRRFSRGNTIPATAVPNGFAFFMPCTDARTLRWVYSYAAGNDEQNRPRLQALSVSHQPSPWMGDRLTFQVMPQSRDIEPTADPSARSLAFDHRDEQARPHHYRVRLQDGTVAELAPADHAVAIRVTFPAGSGRLIFDNADEHAQARVGADGVLTGWSDSIPGPRGEGAGRMFVHGYAVGAQAVGGGRLTDGAGPDTAAYLDLDGEGEATEVTFYLATSFLSAAQARRNLELEIGPRGQERTFDEIAAAAADLWDERLRVLEIDGAGVDDEQLTTLYSNLYRLNLYPNSGHENVGSAQQPEWVHASPGLAPSGPHTDTETGSRVLPGRLYVNNGFWDTYRTAWPAYVLLYPDLAAELVDGFVQHYREAGWIPRWSSPGFADCMVGTSSDIAFADALVKGVDGFDVAAAYDSALRNASVPSDDTRVGRKSLEQAVFLGYTPAEETQGMSWSIDGYLNDFGIASMAAWLLERERDPAARRRLSDELAWFSDRARGYVRLFAADRGFFHGRWADGTWHEDLDAFDPDVWSDDYTETNAWNMAFTVPHDGEGLARLYGGRDALAARLEAFFARPERASEATKGAHRHVIHEMTEARDVRMGMLGHSNQPSHHIPFMWLHAGRPDRTQATVRELMARYHVGAQIGQGYGGDEDNGEMSAWHLFATLGLYPAAVGSPVYSLGSPLYGRVRVRRPGRPEVTVTADGQSREAWYVAGVAVDGVPQAGPWLTQEAFDAAGTITFTMSTTPSAWGSDPAAAPPSLTAPGEDPTVLHDITCRAAVTAPDGVEARGLVDDSSATCVMLPGDAVIEVVPAQPCAVELYTLTGPRHGSAPTSWRLEARAEDGAWELLDERNGESFRWARQTRPFRVRAAGDRVHAAYRLVLGGPAEAAVGLSQIELMARTLVIGRE